MISSVFTVSVVAVFVIVQSAEASAQCNLDCHTFCTTRRNNRNLESSTCTKGACECTFTINNCKNVLLADASYSSSSGGYRGDSVQVQAQSSGGHRGDATLSGQSSGGYRGDATLTGQSSGGYRGASSLAGQSSVKGINVNLQQVQPVQQVSAVLPVASSGSLLVNGQSASLTTGGLRMGVSPVQSFAMAPAQTMVGQSGGYKGASSLAASRGNSMMVSQYTQGSGLRGGVASGLMSAPTAYAASLSTSGMRSGMMAAKTSGGYRGSSQVATGVVEQKYIQHSTQSMKCQTVHTTTQAKSTDDDEDDDDSAEVSMTGGNKGAKSVSSKTSVSKVGQGIH